MAVEQWMMWTGKLKLASRSAGGGVEVTARIVMKPNALVTEVSNSVDAFGQPRWEWCAPQNFDAESLCRALAKSGKAVDPAASVQPFSNADIHEGGTR